VSAIPLHFEARLVDDAELRFTPSGTAVANFRIAASERVKDESTGEWKDSDPVFLGCTAWRDMGENVCEHLRKGDLVLITGKLKQRTYETKEGEKRTVTEVDVSNIGKSLKWKDKGNGSRKPARDYDDSQVPF
jgi:single-strand DNA-binding protein